MIKNIILVILISTCLTSCSYINRYMGWKDDNIAEEAGEFAVESAIQYQTGIRPNIDFTPSTKEK